MDDTWINGSSREFTVSITGCAYRAELILDTMNVDQSTHAIPVICTCKNVIWIF